MQPDFHNIFNQFPIFELNHVIMRQHSDLDAENYLKYVSNDEVNQFIPAESLPRDIESARRAIRYYQNLFFSRQAPYWAIVLKNSNQLIGCAGFNFWNNGHRRAEISYELCRNYWKMGIMTGVVANIIIYAFEVLKVHRLQATIVPDNINSIRLLKRLGFQEEGIMREQKILHGKLHDAIMISLLEQEYYANINFYKECTKVNHGR